MSSGERRIEDEAAVHSTMPYPDRSREEPQVVGRIMNLPGSGGTMGMPFTVGDLMRYCVRHRIGLDEAVVTGGHMRWTRTESPADVAERIAARAANLAATEERERETLARLLAKYGEQ